MAKEWFERGGFLYDMTREFGRLRNENVENALKSFEGEVPLNDDEKKYIKDRIPKDTQFFDYYAPIFDWRKGRIKPKNRRYELQSFGNTNFIYKLPDYWNTDCLLRYSDLWTVPLKYWPEVEQLHYSIDAIIKNYDYYGNWSAIVEVTDNRRNDQKWVLIKQHKQLKTDIATSFRGPYSLFIYVLEGKNINNDYFSDKKNRSSFRSYIEKYPELKAFLQVLYTIGNIYPTDHNPGPGGYNPNNDDASLKVKLNDGLDKKLVDIKKHFDDNGDGDLGETIRDYYRSSDKTFIDFINDNYLNDYFSENLSVCSILNLQDINDWNNVTNLIDELNEKKILTYFLNATKLIIQRGYRIFYQYKRDKDGIIKYENGKPIINEEKFNKDLSFKDPDKNEDLKDLKEAFREVGLENLEIIK